MPLYAGGRRLWAGPPAGQAAEPEDAPPDAPGWPRFPPCPVSLAHLHRGAHPLPVDPVSGALPADKAVPPWLWFRLLSDNGPGYVSRAFRDYLGMVGIRHILAAPFHPQTNGKPERYHQTLKRDVNQLPYEMPSNLEAAIVAFVKLLQIPPLSQGPGKRDALRCDQGKAAGDLTTQKGGAGPNNPTTKTAQQGTQGACETSINPLVYRVSKCPNFAGWQQLVSSGEFAVLATIAD